MSEILISGNEVASFKIGQHTREGSTSDSCSLRYFLTRHSIMMGSQTLHHTDI